MKIAVSSNGEKLDSQVDPRFGRCPFFVIFEVEDGKIKSHETVENTSAEQFGGAGITAAEAVANEGAKVVITENVGPRAYDIFSQLGIEVYAYSGTVKQAIEMFIAGKLEKVSSPGPMGKPPGQGKGRM